jgi:hypothetical protein
MGKVYEYASARGGTVPDRALNGGLYTGAPFASSAWANTPIVPDSNVMVQDGLLIGHAPPPGARTQLVSWQRPGNELASADGLVYDERLHMMVPATDGVARRRIFSQPRA